MQNMCITSYIYVFAVDICAFANYIYCHQEIKVDNESKGVTACKMALYRTFLKCGVATWETVVDALEGSDYDNIAKEVKMKLIDCFKK